MTFLYFSGKINNVWFETEDCLHGLSYMQKAIDFLEFAMINAAYALWSEPAKLTGREADLCKRLLETMISSACISEERAL